MSQGTGKHIVDFTEVRAQKLDEKRRKNERIFFKQLLGVYCVTESDNLRQIELIEVSEDGLSFQVPADKINQIPTVQSGEFVLRLYFSQDTYLPIHVRIQNSTPSIEEGVRYVRFGCAVDQHSTGFPAFLQFVRCLKLYSESSHKDLGDISVFYL